MKRTPQRSDDKYWEGTRKFKHNQYISDLQDHIMYLMEMIQILKK